MKKYFLILMIVLAGAALAGCQNEPAQPGDSSTATTQNSGASQKVYEDHGMPYSDGPTNPPAVKGPTALPPNGNIDGQAQAVTTNENIRLTLPRKSE